MRSVLAFAVLAVALGASPALAAGTAPRSSYFISSCAYSHHAPDDPIVFPREPGFSHDHTFVGNVSTNAFSTTASLRAARTSCDPRGDSAAYWAPTLYAGDKPVLPLGAAIYYRRLTTAPVRAFPPGLRMVAGNSHAVAPQSLAVTYWDCELVKTTIYGPNLRGSSGFGSAEIATASSSVPNCPPKTKLELHVNFPDCWNGKSLDSADHKAHMAYSVDGRCPASHPVPVPAISLVYRYPPSVATATTILSSGGQHSGHADFINTWHQSALARLVRSCLDGHADPTMEASRFQTAQQYNNC